MELRKELADQFEDVKNRLVLRLGQISTQLHGVGGSMAELYAETSRHGGLYLMANGELVDKSLMQGHPFPATLINIVHTYLLDFDEKYIAFFHDAYLGPNSKRPYPTIEELLSKLPKESVESALEKIIKIMGIALTEEPYTAVGFGVVTPNQITVINNSKSH